MKLLLCVSSDEAIIFLPGSKTIECTYCKRKILLSKESSERENFKEFIPICINCLPKDQEIEIMPPTKKEINSLNRYFNKENN